MSALQLLFVGDALSMPVHWFYRPMDIWRAFPPQGVRQLEAAPELHPSSIMSLHSTSGGGRSAGRKKAVQGAPRQIVGDVILKGKAQYWNQSQVHYHHGLEAGENTLNTWCAHLLLNWVTERAEQGIEPLYDATAWLEHYVDFMTADSPRHPDTYAESYHRGFFANLVAGKALDQSGAVTHDTPSMGALVTLAPLAISLLQKESLANVQAICRAHVWSTHPDKLLLEVVDSYVKLMHQLLDAEDADDQTIVSWFCEAAMVVNGGDISRLCKGFPVDSGDLNEISLMRMLSEDMTVVGSRYSLACYITDSWPSVCYLAARHFNDPERALLINTNLGGENAHRGSVLGTLLGLASGRSVDRFYTGLAQHEKIEGDIGRFVSSLEH